MPAPFHDTSDGPLRLAALLSGSGTNIRKIIEHQKKLEEKEKKSPFKVVALFSDSIRSRAPEIGKDFDIPVIIRDIDSFYSHRNKKRSDLSIRPEFDLEIVKALSPYGVNAAVYGGYMSIVTSPLIEAFWGFNVHPADLSIEIDGIRRFTGGHAVRDAILAGEKTIAASTHIIEQVVDGGRLLMISQPLPVVIKKEWDLSIPDDLKKAENFNQERLKKAGDWVIYPKTIEYIARGRFGKDETGLLYFDDKPIPKGLRWEDHRETAR